MCVLDISNCSIVIKYESSSNTLVKSLKHLLIISRGWESSTYQQINSPLPLPPKLPDQKRFTQETYIKDASVEFEPLYRLGTNRRAAFLFRVGQRRISCIVAPALMHHDSNAGTPTHKTISTIILAGIPCIQTSTCT